MRELPCDVSFRHAPDSEWEIGPARIRAASVSHRGPTLGYRIDDGDSSLTYIPDHEPGLGADLDRLEDDWISGFALAQDTSLLIHDGQYTDAEYPDHIGWGHSPLRDALAFAHRTGAERTVLFHHDPMHSDEFLDRFGAEAQERWAALGGDPAAIELGAERTEYELPARAGQPVAAPERAALARLRQMPAPTIEAAAAESELIAKALEMAEEAHAGQTRNGSGGMAYIHHPIAVAELLAEHDFEEARRGALLHDVVEDSEASVDDVAAVFGQRVAGWSRR